MYEYVSFNVYETFRLLSKQEIWSNDHETRHSLILSVPVPVVERFTKLIYCCAAYRLATIARTDLQGHQR